VSRADYLIVSCEHGGNRIPPRFRALFSKKFLSTHRGYDPGALDVARDFAAATGAPFFYSTVSRLLVELNRPLGHPQVFYSRLSEETRDALLRRYYLPYWRSIESAIARAIRRGRRVLHLSVHSFTPKLRGVRRATDIGLLYDPARALEARFCRSWRAAILRRHAGLRVRYNKPYRGSFPSLVDELRQRFGPRYIGIQVEISQRFARGDARRWRSLRGLLAESFQRAVMMYSTSVLS
jgi:predicted N-formylglutamate amidohydrolase